MLTMRTLHLFAGAGGGLLADLILGHTPVAAVEWDGYRCAVLRERRDDGWFPGLVVHECDVRAFDPAEYVGRVDAIHAGFPCTDISVAGKQAGIAAGTRSGLWSEVVRCARVIRPRYLMLENVAAITGLGLDIVLSDLAALGFDARWDCVSAADVGANHKRDRWWCFAWLANAESESSDGRNDHAGIGMGGTVPEFGNDGGADNVADAGSEGLDVGNRADGLRQETEYDQNREAIELGCASRGRETVADAECVRSPRQGESVDAVHTAQGGNGEAIEFWNGGWWLAESDVGLLVDRLAVALG